MEKAVVDQLLFELNRDRMKVRIEFLNFFHFNFYKRKYIYFSRFRKLLNNWYLSRKIIKVKII